MDTDQTRTLSNDEKVRITVEFFRNQFDAELDPAAIEKIREPILAYDRGASIGATDQLDETDSKPGIFLSPSAVRNLMASLPANDRGASTGAISQQDIEKCKIVPQLTQEAGCFRSVLEENLFHVNKEELAEKCRAAVTTESDAVMELIKKLTTLTLYADTDALNLDDEAVADNVADINDAANVVIMATVTATDATAPELAGMGSVLTTED